MLRLQTVRGPGSRAYLAIRGGIDVPEYLGSRATFTLGLFGGHGGRALRTGDVLHIAPDGHAHADGQLRALAPALIPVLNDRWEIAVLPGPHAAPDFFTPGDIEVFFATEWRVHYNSSRTGVRLIGPKPAWARRDGGEAGLHPSNIHDTAYAIGTVDYTGDMPVILGPDGPSLGGFVCPATIVAAELWKMGQLKAGDRVRFRAVTLDEARALLAAQQSALATLETRDSADTRPRRATFPLPIKSADSAGAILRQTPADGERPALTIRQDGDANLLVEYGPMVLDLELRFRVHALQQALAQRQLSGVIDLTPGIRSLQIHYDDARLPRERLLEILAEAEAALPPAGDIEVPSRIVHLPLSWNDPSTQLAIAKYMQSVRPDAPWCPSNIEFIRRINGLGQHRRGARHRLRRALPGAGPRRRLSRRAGRDADRSAPSPGHDQVQPRAHLDARERRRHRRRLPVRLRHGRSRRLPVRGTHLPDVEPLSRDRRLPRRDALAAALLRSDSLLPGQRAGAARLPRRVPARPGAPRDRRDDVPHSPTTARSCATTRRRSTRSSGASKRRSRQSANAGRRCRHHPSRRVILPDHPTLPRPAPRRCPRARRRCAPRFPEASGRCW